MSNGASGHIWCAPCGESHLPPACVASAFVPKVSQPKEHKPEHKPEHCAKCGHLELEHESDYCDITGCPCEGWCSPTKESRESKGDPEYLKLLDELRALHLKKAADYGSGVDPLANLRASVNLGISPWVGAMLRASDKMTRVYSMIRNGSLANESIEDNLLDQSAYCLLALRLYREEKVNAQS